ncbi:hypothetical protein GCM10009555_093140 [Acrocarpospora macrocephala]|uniref:Uncharacterized protein n=1 Tax=Acrocarpospora macrocephala TaxID=150177 RepID=A0A5M3WZZ0_9ACTN|nr:hypothetical protein [Acrocarpospora macrocephala]GES13986.1 hypothetical protein Amac_075830 [Acrocarpospora macrocephala]
MGKTAWVKPAVAAAALTAAFAAVGATTAPASATTVASEQSCLATKKFGRTSSGSRIEFTPCVKTDGKVIALDPGVACFAYGISRVHRLKDCRATGAWSLYKDGERVASSSSKDAKYPGPGTYTLTADLQGSGSWRLSDSRNRSGSVQVSAGGSMEGTITLTDSVRTPSNSDSRKRIRSSR